MILKLKNVSKYFGEISEQRVCAVDNIDMTLMEGDFVSLIGPSGSGKTTLLNIISGLEVPSQGEVMVCNQNIYQLNFQERTKFRLMNMGFVFQNYELLDVLTCYENVELSLQLQKMDGNKIKEKVEWALHEVGLWDLRNRYPSQMSGGQNQRVSIARALTGQPKIILADEPTANLDSKTASSIIDMFHVLNQKYKTTFLFSTHDPRLIERVKHTLKIQDGKWTN
jgi:putative ABC transport system ATP-binding protein